MIIRVHDPHGRTISSTNGDIRSASCGIAVDSTSDCALAGPVADDDSRTLSPECHITGGSSFSSETQRLK